MLPGYRSAAERMNADFVMLALAVAASPAQLRIPRFVIGIFDGVKEQQRRTAGGVHLAVVVRLHNLHVKSLAQNLGGLLAQVAEQRHAHAHVGGTEYGDLPGGLVHLLLLLRRIAGGGQNHGKMVLHGICQQGGQRFRPGKIHNDRAAAIGQRVKARMAGKGAVPLERVHPGHNFDAIGGCLRGYGTAHVAQCATDEYLHGKTTFLTQSAAYHA